MRMIAVLALMIFSSFAVQQVRAQDSLSPEDNLDEPSLPTTGNDGSLSPGKPKTVEKKVAAPSKPGGNVLDFEGEVIEGERRRPDLFLQMSIDNVKFDSLIYNREDFNDYLEVDRKSRTRFLKLK